MKINLIKDLIFKNNKNDDWVIIDNNNGKIKEINIKIKNNENETKLIKKRNFNNWK